MLYAPGHDFGMVLFGSDETENALHDRNEGHCPNVKTVRTLTKIDLEFFRAIETFAPEAEPVDQQNGGTIMDALDVSLDMLDRFCGARKYRKRLFLITDGEKAMEKDNRRINEQIKTMQEKDVRLNVITLDFGNELGQDEDSESDKENDIIEERENN